MRCGTWLRSNPRSMLSNDRWGVATRRTHMSSAGSGFTESEVQIQIGFRIHINGVDGYFHVFGASRHVNVQR